MTGKQRMLLRTWAVFAGLLIWGWIFQSEPWIARAGFVPVLIYLSLNWGTLRELEKVGPSPKEVIGSSSIAKYWVVICLFAEIALAYGALFMRVNFGSYISGYWSLFIALVLPLAVPILISQRTLYQRLGNGIP